MDHLLECNPTRDAGKKRYTLTSEPIAGGLVVHATILGGPHNVGDAITAALALLRADAASSPGFVASQSLTIEFRQLYSPQGR